MIIKFKTDDYNGFFGINPEHVKSVYTEKSLAMTSGSTPTYATYTRISMERDYSYRSIETIDEVINKLNQTNPSFAIAADWLEEHGHVEAANSLRNTFC